MLLYSAFSCNIKRTANLSKFEQDVIRSDTSVCYLPFIQVTDERLLETLDLIIKESVSDSIVDKCAFLSFFTLVALYNDEDFAGFKVFMHKTRAFISISDDSNKFAVGFYHKHRLFIIKNLKINFNPPFGYRQDSLISVIHCSSGCLPSYSFGNIIYKDTITFERKIEEIPEVYFNNK